ncbi:2-keto-4-pentenoate hydratase [Myceligenerans indicum]|uniref:2-keto-4-pentenoate hydratase n=1 Tax=Myceligenerans indicum TaxID=2593663 RepID=A0ABS1LMC0_9MICO|nr:fumarylacetoacetate hydrolase family protein [Myceligenerans indicum]MBL0887415.1 2-keto-4-pentenoate hydratase [Myceligenerans indicum]
MKGTSRTAALRPELQALADALWEARRSGEPIERPSATTHPGLRLDEAYAVQRAVVARRVASGERVVGHKVGLTSRAMQSQLGVSEPDFGTLTDAMVVPDGGRIDTEALLAPRIEPEFAFRVGAPLVTSPSMGEVREAITDVALAVEVIDSRVRDWRIGLVDTVADNASSACLAVGRWRRATAEVLSRIPDTVVTLGRDGQEVAAGPGSAVLGGPVAAVHWLATAIGRHGRAFAPGDVVLAGAVAAAVPLTPGTRWEAAAEGFGPVAVTAAATREKE